MADFTFWDIAKQLLLALRWTVGLSLIAFAGGSLLGMALLVLRLARLPGAQRFVAAYVQVFQGTPLLMQLFLTYFGLAMVGVDTSPLLAASVCLILYSSAYLCEIWRGCVEAVPRGQWEASASLAMGFTEQLRHVILPQALRMGIAPTAGFSVQIIKGTALTSVIGFIEITKAGQLIANATFEPFLIYGCVAALYFALCFPLSLWSQRLERRLRPRR
ncbi:polar amino acid ABC transporter, inner membrane subunit [Acidovorax delafieldii 2AN]|uniref:Polar amino acid ABC transporter, inner membrane subunit n=1 Tax=Acidovorax delafieldii 2AN TaxID=573060 RepID=C5TA37_ACIDE|nr:amino acid ABC transporter permease [Acidovorax delafieldii]EER58663.1 polar amino acid ABC transporter, inner membrane subunit [Acidovorax delafieldii 2AN]